MSSGRIRAQCSFKMPLAKMPGPSASVAIRKIAARPPISMRRRGMTSLPAIARNAGATRSVISKVAASRTYSVPTQPHAQNEFFAGS